jgi:hypothetical protein
MVVFQGIARILFELYDMAEEYKTPGLKEQVLEDLLPPSTPLTVQGCFTTWCGADTFRTRNRERN